MKLNLIYSPEEAEIRNLINNIEVFDYNNNNILKHIKIKV